MDKKEIQRQRMMTYFIDAAKEILREEGVKGLSARKVGDRAGYSYATIYNYFKDLNELLVYCTFDYLEDCYQYLTKYKKDSLNAKEQLMVYTIAYFKYFAENPDTFQLVFVEEIGNPPEELLQNRSIPSVAKLLGESIMECAKAGYISEDAVDTLGELIASSVHGKLLFYINRRTTEEEEDIIKLIRSEVEFLIKK
ncbi:AcrR family transcriptional regulator [Alkaliphilus hydrothermalis]|uniref:AcrR family transcriptional regulator n=2 Tax=Alkaliphilus hydrothermalis TaxID=1482730 RepID=A0ABS2NMP5_9FIRM|nr:AcrR family transcriptional regulator [Alkaliphilus hydrothermalis]